MKKLLSMCFVAAMLLAGCGGVGKQGKRKADSANQFRLSSL